jgi:CRAL/TRIO domain/CRAL/TRIO, N-terminal domain
MATAAPQDPIQTKQESKPADTLLSEKTAALEISGPTSEAPSSTEASSIKAPADEKPAEQTQPPATEGTVAVSNNESAEPPAHTGPVLVPFATPLPSCKPQAPAELTAEQSKKYDELLALATGWTEVPQTAARNAPKDAVTDEDRLWLTRECLLRYLRASRWDVAAAAKRILATLTWRREYGLVTFTADYISPENETGKQVVMGYDNDARPCLYLNPSKQNTARTERQIHHLVFMLERVIDLMGPGQETLALLINFADTRSGQGASVGQGKQVMNILQSHYPERLGRALISERGSITSSEYL